MARVDQKKKTRPAFFHLPRPPPLILPPPLPRCGARHTLVRWRQLSRGGWGSGGGQRARARDGAAGHEATAKHNQKTDPPPFFSPQAPNSPCNQFVNQIRQQASAIAYSTCDKPVTVSTKPTPQCCELAAKFTPCKCDADVHKTSGKELAIATYRSTQVGCGGKCVEPNTVGC